jgi:hypothetical protein
METYHETEMTFEYFLRRHPGLVLEALQALDAYEQDLILSYHFLQIGQERLAHFFGMAQNRISGALALAETRIAQVLSNRNPYAGMSTIMTTPFQSSTTPHYIEESPPLGQFRIDVSALASDGFFSQRARPLDGTIL